LRASHTRAVSTRASESELTTTNTLRSSGGLEVDFITYGGRITSIRVPDHRGDIADVTPGYASLDDYARDPLYLGAIIGRYANRIGHSRFPLDGHEYVLTPNEGKNQLHGGPGGFHQATWSVDRSEDGCSAILSIVSPAGDQGFPGRLEVAVTYSVTVENELVVDYEAMSSEPTPVNLTQHAFFNLSGHASGDILGHELTLAASSYTPVDRSLIPTGEIERVQGTPFDFTTPHRIGDRIHDRHEQMLIGGGYDHNFVLDGRVTSEPRFAARLVDPASGRTLEILTTEPGVQFYAGGGFGRVPRGKEGFAYAANAALALETQHYPDSPNRPEFPSTIVRPGEKYRSRSIYRFANR
jgi:aldose 1-epimerase